MSDLCDPDITMATHRPTFSVPVTIPHSKSGVSNVPLTERLSPDNKPKVQHEIQLLKG